MERSDRSLWVCHHEHPLNITHCQYKNIDVYICSQFLFLHIFILQMKITCEQGTFIEIATLSFHISGFTF